MEMHLSRKLQPKQGREGEERPHAPSPVHPDDVPFDPELQRKWEEARGITRKPSGPKPNDDGTVDFNVDLNYLERKK